MTEPASMLRRHRGLVIFWLLIIAGAASGAAYLQYLGPPPTVEASLPAPSAPPAPAPVAPADIAPPAATQPAPAGFVPITAPVPALLAPSAINRQWLIPRIGPDGATPMRTYAAAQVAPDAALMPPATPRIALIVAGLGDDLALAQVAAALPPAVAIALSPYGKSVTEAADAARAGGHEMLLVLPMPGLLAGAPASQNQAALDWSMAQIQGYAGVTDAFSPAMGGGFMASPAAKKWLLANVAGRGLYYIEGDANAGAAPIAAGRTADIVIDGASGEAAESTRLGTLITDAESQHSALGIMLNPNPDALRILASWSDTLVNEDIMLVPVSALVTPPGAKP